MSYLDKLGRFERESDISPESSAPDITLDVATDLRPVYWESKGVIVGPGRVASVAQNGGIFWLCLEYGGAWRWINSDLLRSREAFETQGLQVCNCCKGSDFWTSVYNVVVCRDCHPPGSPELEKGVTTHES